MNLVISGKGGTGKTFTVLHKLMERINEYPLVYTRDDEYYRSKGIDPEHKYLAQGVPGVLFVSYTNPAVTVLRRSIDTTDLVMSYISPQTGEHTLRNVQPSDLAMTVNKLLQFRPADPETASNLGISTGAFYPYRDSVNRLPPEITTIVLDEVGLLEIKLTIQLMASLDLTRVQFIFIGDICQTGASYGPSTLIRALVKLPRIAFDKTYRFSGELLAFADEVNDGKVEGITGQQLLRTSDNKSGDKDVINIGFFTPPEESSEDKALDRIRKSLYTLITKDIMCLYTDLFIVPQKTQLLSGNVIMGSVFSLLDRLYGRPTFFLNTNSEPIILAVGDSILYDNKIGMVLDIGKNDNYVGNLPQEPMYVNTRDVETWCLLYDKKYLNTVDSIVVNHEGEIASQTLDRRVMKPITQDDILAGLAGDMDMPEDIGNTTQEDEDDEESGTRQLTNQMIVLDITAIDNGFVNYDPKDVDKLYKTFTRELLENSLFKHNSRQPHEVNTISDDTVAYYEDLVYRLADKYGIPKNDVKVINMTRTSDLSSQGVKYNWRTVQQTQGSQSYSTFSVFSRKFHVASLMFRENLYTAFSRSMSKQYSVMSKALLDGSLNSGGVNGQRYPGKSVAEKLKMYIKRVRSVSQDEIKLDGILDKLLEINKTRATYYKETGKNLLLDEQSPEPKKGVVSSVNISLSGNDNEAPF